MAVSKNKTSRLGPPTGIVPNEASGFIADTLAVLGVNADVGLNPGEVESRRPEHGYNEVAEKKGHPAFDFLKKFDSSEKSMGEFWLG